MQKHTLTNVEGSHQNTQLFANGPFLYILSLITQHNFIIYSRLF